MSENTAMSDEKLRVLETLENESVKRRRRAVVVSWLLVALAASGTAGLVACSAVTINRLRAETRQESARLAGLREERKKLNQELVTLRATAENYRSVVQAESAKVIETRGADQGGAVAEQKARVFLQIVAPTDRGPATRIGRALADKYGYAVPGVEYVAGAGRLKNTEVRYYRQADEAGARRLLQALRELQVASPNLLYLNLEKDPKVRGNQYEVWFASGGLTVTSSSGVPARIVRIVQEQLGVDERQVIASARFAEDLGADTLDVVELVLALEDEYRIVIADADAERFTRVADVVEYLQKRKLLR